MYIPKGFKQKGKIYKLKKSFYGLKQSPIRWNIKLTTTLKNNGLTQLKTEPYIFTNDEKTLFLAIYVDDGILIGENEDDMNKLLKKLKQEFEMTVQQNPKSFLGMEIVKNESGLLIKQEAYTNYNHKMHYKNTVR